MLALIERAAKHGPPSDERLCRTLGDEIYELKKAGLRILFFYDMDHTMICTHGYRKQSNKLGHGQRSRAPAARASYFEAKRAGKLEVSG